MNTKPNRLVIILPFLLVSLSVLATCQNSNENSLELTPPSVLNTQTVVQHSIVESTRIPSPTPPVTVSVSIIATPSKDTPSVIKEWLETNLYCQLPCWWGVAPGITTWEIALDGLKPYASMISQRGKADFYVGEFNFFDVFPDSSTGAGINVKMLFISDVAQEIEVYGFNGSPLYYLPRFLQSYGQPSEVWIHTYRSYLGGIPPADVNLFYPEQGVLARFSTLLTAIDEAEDSATICLDDNPALYLWSPLEIMTFEQADDHFRLGYNEYSKPLLSLEQAVGISVEQFYGYRTKERICLTTKLSLWPEP